jgi:hypothetical protein
VKEIGETTSTGVLKLLRVRGLVGVGEDVNADDGVNAGLTSSASRVSRGLFALLIAGLIFGLLFGI